VVRLIKSYTDKNYVLYEFNNEQHNHPDVMLDLDQVLTTFRDWLYNEGRLPMAMEIYRPIIVCMLRRDTRLAHYERYYKFEV